MKKDKYYYIHILTIFDIADFRFKGKINTGEYTKEPSDYENDLFELYSQLNLEQLIKLVELRENQHKR